MQSESSDSDDSSSSESDSDSESDKKKAHMKHRGGAPVGGGGVSAGTNLNALWQKKQ